MAASDRARGKEFERWVGGKLGGRRKLAYERGHADTEGTPLAVECKAGYERPQLPAKWLKQAERHQVETGLPWAIVQRPKHWRDPIVTMRFSTLFNREVLTALLALTNQEGTKNETRDHSG